jgi:hypothetical protein
VRTTLTMIALPLAVTLALVSGPFLLPLAVLWAVGAFLWFALTDQCPIAVAGEGVSSAPGTITITVPRHGGTFRLPPGRHPGAGRTNETVTLLPAEELTPVHTGEEQVLTIAANRSTRYPRDLSLRGGNNGRPLFALAPNEALGGGHETVSPTTEAPAAQPVQPEVTEPVAAPYGWDKVDLELPALALPASPADYSALSYKELQSLCKGRDLRAVGKREDLVARLTEDDAR